MTISFENYLSKEEYNNLFNLYNDKDKDERPKEAFYKNKVVFDKALFNMLVAINRKNKFKPLKEIEGHLFQYVSSWDKLINEKSMNEHEQESLTGLFFIKLIGSFRNYNDSNEINDLYNSFVSLMNNGNFEWFDLNRNTTCSKCGLSCHFEFKNWQMSVVEYDHKIKMEKSPSKCIEDKIVNLEIEFKSNELLVADWFRIEEFSEEVEYDKDYDKVSINYAKGRINSTKHAVNNYNFITVHVGNTCPNIFQKTDDFIFGHMIDDSKVSLSDYKEVGHVCTDLWNVTLIEKENLIKIIAKKLGEEKAKEKVEEYLKENKGNYTKFKIKPGKYNLRFYGNAESFSKLESKDQFPKEIKPYFTLKKG